MQAKLLLIDVDGTLVGRDGIHPSTWPALERAHARGVHVGLCTGRIGSGVTQGLAQAVSPDGLHVFQNGAVVSRADAPAEFTSALPPAACRALIDAARREDAALELYSERRYFLERDDERTRAHERHLELAAEHLSFDALPEPVLRAMWLVGEARWAHVRDLTLALGGLEIHPATSPIAPGTLFCNVTRTGTSKASAVRWLAARLGVELADAVMVGDAANDLEVMEVVGFAIAMGNGDPRVRERANAVVGDVDAGGLAAAIDLALARGDGGHDAAGSPAVGDEPFVLPIERELDLHAFAPRDVPDVVRDYLEAARAQGFTEVRLVHGKGIGVQRERVRALLATHPDVESFADAPPARGHWGATLVRLRPGGAGAPPGP